MVKQQLNAQALAQAKPTQKAQQEVVITPIKITEMNIGIMGTTPLLMEKMSDKVIESLTNIMEGKGKEKKPNRNFEQEVKDKIHYTADGKVGFPASGFKKAIVEAAPYMADMDKKLARSIVVIGDMIEIKFKQQVTNKAMGRDSGIRRAPRPIWRPEFKGWSCTLKVRFNNSQITADQVVNLIKLAGFHIGVGGWTPQHSGSYGMFTVASGGK